MDDNNHLEKKSKKNKLLDCAILCFLVFVICVSIIKPYFFLSPKESAFFLCFWERGSVKREFQEGLILLTNASYILLGISLFGIIIQFITRIFLLLKKQIEPNRFVIQQIVYLILFFVAFWVLIKSWDGAIP